MSKHRAQLEIPAYKKVVSKQRGETETATISDTHYLAHNAPEDGYSARDFN